MVDARLHARPVSSPARRPPRENVNSYGQLGRITATSRLTARLYPRSVDRPKPYADRPRATSLSRTAHAHPDRVEVRGCERQQIQEGHMAANTLSILKPSVNNLTVRVFVRAAGLDFEEIDVWGK